MWNIDNKWGNNKADKKRETSLALLIAVYGVQTSLAVRASKEVT